MPVKATLKRSVRQTADEADRVRELVAKFDRGPVTKQDVLEACKIIQHEAVLLHDGGHRAAELLARCLIEMLEKGAGRKRRAKESPRRKRGKISSPQSLDSLGFAEGRMCKIPV
uniref:Uncharacterized protein n=1 Tax=Ammonifex degensii TaxID=42838 RepID=A0A7C2E3C0_9THEO